MSAFFFGAILARVLLHFALAIYARRPPQATDLVALTIGVVAFLIGRANFKRAFPRQPPNPDAK